MRLAPKLIPALTGLALALALSGCGGRFSQVEDKAPAPLPSPSATPTAAANTPDQDAKLAEIQADLDTVEGATNQSGNDVLDGDNATLQDDTK
jgi:hypothetical protein